MLAESRCDHVCVSPRGRAKVPLVNRVNCVPLVIVDRERAYESNQCRRARGPPSRVPRAARPRSRHSMVATEGRHCSALDPSNGRLRVDAARAVEQPEEHFAVNTKSLARAVASDASGGRTR